MIYSSNLHFLITTIPIVDKLLDLDDPTPLSTEWWREKGYELGAKLNALTGDPREKAYELGHACAEALFALKILRDSFVRGFREGREFCETAYGWMNDDADLEVEP